MSFMVVMIICFLLELEGEVTWAGLLQRSICYHRPPLSSTHARGGGERASRSPTLGMRRRKKVVTPATISLCQQSRRYAASAHYPERAVLTVAESVPSIDQPAHPVGAVEGCRHWSPW